MSGRSRVTLPDGRTVIGFRKTLRRNPRRPKVVDPEDLHCDLPFQLRFGLPAAIAGAVSPGPANVAGVEVLKGDRVEVTGHGLEWVCKQAAAFIGVVAGGQNLELPFTVERGAYRASAKLIYVPGASVVFPRAVKKALVFEVRR